ncbi:MAG: hypothetical protein WKG07_29750 [Hymenobacter sp.]
MFRRRLAGQGLQFEYTGANDLLPAVFGLRELVLPVSVLDARLAASSRRSRAAPAPRPGAACKHGAWCRARPSACWPAAVAGLCCLICATVARRLAKPRAALGASSRLGLPQQAALAQPSFTLPAAEALVDLAVR